MRRDTKKKERISDIVGICSGILLLAFLVFNIVWANTVHTVGVRNNAVPDSAMTVQGTADAFPDCDDASVRALAASGVIAGYPDGTFGPDKTINRAEIAKIICVLTK